MFLDNNYILQKGSDLSISKESQILGESRIRKTSSWYLYVQNLGNLDESLVYLAYEEYIL